MKMLPYKELLEHDVHMSISIQNTYFSYIIINYKVDIRKYNIRSYFQNYKM